MKKLFFNQVTVVYCTALLILLLAPPAMAEEPLEVGIVLKVSQITSINQKAENFGVVATLRMEWLTSELAVASEKQVPKQRLYKAEEFLKILTERQLLWPAHSFENLQGRIDYQNRIVAVDPQGNVKYLARFTATFQAPDFDFKEFPFDKQNFYLALDSFVPGHLIQFTPIFEYSGLGDTLGEEEWVLDDAKIEITNHDTFGVISPRLVLSFQ